ncbi:MAG: hypothetical protein AB7T49_09315 [Oligoflexales bacterium]
MAVNGGLRSPFLLLLLGLIGCDNSAEMHAVLLQDNEVQPQTFLAESIVIEDAADFYYRLFKQDFVTNLEQLNSHSNGILDDSRIPYSDFWFPEQTGGTNKGVTSTTEGALTKYDKAFYNGANNKAAQWEGTNHSSEVSWYGHCNGFSTSVSRHQMPQKSVVRPQGCSGASCVEFKPHDIRALLAEIYMNAKARFLAGNRCNLEQSQLNSSPQNRLDPTKLDACDDVGPAGFHLALVNWIGIQKQPLIFDESRDIQVWNYPLYGYTYTTTPITKEQAIQITGRTGATDYEFNKSAVSFVKIHNHVRYRDALNKFLPAVTKGAVDCTSEKFDSLAYILELDDIGNIIGGEWIQDQVAHPCTGTLVTVDSRIQHPDFIWAAFEPFDSPGTRKFGNPFVKNDEVVSMWAESVGLDPANPFGDPGNPNRILNYPSTDSSWGRVQHFFAVTLDGTNRGAVFLGKKARLVIKREEELVGNVNVKVLLNGAPLTDIAGTGSDDLSYDFDSKPGINNLSLQWSKNGQNIAAANVELEYFAVP